MLNKPYSLSIPPNFKPIVQSDKDENLVTLPKVTSIKTSEQSMIVSQAYSDSKAFKRLKKQLEFTGEVKKQAT